MQPKKVINSSEKIVNIGGRPVRADIEVVFAEGNPDKEGDSIIDEDADIIGRVTIKSTDWADGIHALQRVTATLDLDKTPRNRGPQNLCPRGSGGSDD